MLESLFNSATRVKILSLFFEDESKRHYIQETIKQTKSDPGNIHRELVKMTRLGVLRSEQVGRQKYFSIKQESLYYDGLRRIFLAYNRAEGGDKWFTMEEMPNYYPMIVANAWSVARANDFFKQMGLESRLTELLSTYENNMCGLWAKRSEFNAAADEIVQRFIVDPDWGENYCQLVIKKSRDLIDASKKMRKMNFAKFSDKQLLRIYEQYKTLYESVHILHWIQTLADLGQNLFSKYLLRYLEKKLKARNRHYSIGDVFSLLTTPAKEGNNTKEYRDLILILNRVARNTALRKYFDNTETRIIAASLKRVNAGLDQRIARHAEKYGWLGYGTVGPGWEKDYFIDILRSLVKQRVKPSQLLAKLANDQKKIIERQQNIVKELSIDSLHSRLFGIARELVFTKGLRKDGMFFNFSVVENLYREIGRRHFLSVSQVRYFYPHEIKDLLSRNKFDAAKLNARYHFSIHYSTGDYKGDTLLEGKAAEKALKSFRFEKINLEDIGILQGDCASPGKARGKVSIVNVAADMQKMEHGNILVSIATNPDLVPAIKKAAAIVTDVGGITCHAAIISRELGVPCVVGAKIATRALHDGDVIDVDATHGKVVVIKKGK